MSKEKIARKLIEKGHSPKSAIIVSTDNAINYLYTSDDVINESIISRNIDEQSGFLTMKAVISRVGVQDYYGFELSEDLEPSKIYGVHRPDNEVFAPDSMKSFINCPATDNHPDEAVTIDNSKDLIKGSISDVSCETSHLISTMTITDKDLIKKITDGKVELSAGYTHELKPQKGDFNGKSYDFIQTNIRANHIAIVDRGRCGGSCKLSLDNYVILLNDEKNKQGGSMKVTINGKEFEVSEEIATALKAESEKSTDAEEVMKKDVEAEKAKTKEEEEKVEVAEKANDELTKVNDSLQATIDATKSNQINDADIQKLVNDRAVIMVNAQSILASSYDAAKTPCEMKREVIAKVLPEMSLDGKSDAYVDASYDMAILKHKEVKDSLVDMGNSFSFDGKSDVKTSHDKYTENLQNAYKGGK